MSELHFSEAPAINVLLARAIEAEDHNALVLTREDRHFATAAALAGSRLSGNPGPSDSASFLGRRASFALERVQARFPALARARSLAHWPGIVGWGVPLAALAAGIATDVLGGGTRLNILAFPLLALILWNFAVFVLIALRASARRGGSGARPLLHMLEWVVRPAAARLAAQPTLERAILRFSKEWAMAAGPLTRARASRTLHLAAALFVLGVLAGMLLRARYTGAYTAGWSGTWAGAEAEIAVMLNILLGPASLLTGIPLPSLERLRDLRGGGENAGSWLILWSVTASLFVVLPRLVLASLSATSAAYLSRRIAVHEDFQLRSLLREAIGRAGEVRVLPYGFALSEKNQAQLTEFVKLALGPKTKVEVDPAIPYGSEDEWLEREGGPLSGPDQLILLFNLASTPEAENHGAFVTGVRREAGASAALAVVLDDSSLRKKLGTNAMAERRMAERVEAWRSVILPAGLSPTIVSLDSRDEDAAAKALEQALAGAEQR